MESLFSENFYVTTPLYYVNGKPHLGHLYSTLIADSLARFARQKEVNTIFLTGTDEHGEKIAKSAKEQGKSSLEYATENANFFKNTWEKLGLTPDIFYRTTQQSHYDLVSNSLQALYEKDLIHFASYEGHYCVGCERYLTDSELNEEGQCPDHLKRPELRQESNYFFRMGKFQQQLVDHYEANPDAILPTGYRNEVLSMLKEPLPDLCISRPVERLEWGIPLPFDGKYVTYVWFDALLNYLGGLGYKGGFAENNPEVKQAHWDNSVHVLGKDIVKTHAIYWPTMLLALGYHPAKKLFVGGYWLVDNQKMSKSLGNVVSPMELVDQYGLEPIRYYLMREAAYGSDASFSLESFVNRANADLANGIGNLASRVLNLVKKNLDSTIPTSDVRTEEDKQFIDKLAPLPEKWEAAFEKGAFHKALESLGECVKLTDQYINDNAPWKLAKDPEQGDRLKAVLGTAMDALWTFAVVMRSVLPVGAKNLAEALGRTEQDLQWSRVGDVPKAGDKTGDVPRLYPRIEVEKKD